MVMGRLVHRTPSVGDAENWLRIERCRPQPQPGPREKGSMRNQVLRDRTSLELQKRLHSRLALASRTANLGDPNPGKEAQPPLTQARSQAGSLSGVCVWGGVPSLPPPLCLAALGSRVGTSVSEHPGSPRDRWS